MSPTRSNIALGLLVLACATLLTLWVQRGREIRDLREALAVAQREQDDTAARLAVADRRLGELESEIVGLRERPMPTPQRIAEVNRGEVGGAAIRVEPGRGPRGGLPSLLDNPDFQKALLAQMRGGLDLRYARLFRRLGLPPDQLGKLKDLLVEKQASTMDAFTAARFAGVNDPEELRSLVEQTQAEIDQNIRALLGEQRFAQMQEFERNAVQYGVADQLERRLSYTETPLLPEQAEELVRILAQTSATAASANDPRQGAGFVSTFVAGAPRDSVGVAAAMPNIVVGGMGPPVISDEALAQAEGVLTAEQLAALAEMQAEQRAAAQMFSSARGAAGVFRAFGPPPTAPSVGPGSGAVGSP